MTTPAKDQTPPPPPGAPTAAAVPLEEPTEPREPLPPTPEQASPATVSPTGADLGAAPTDMGQQGAFLTTSTGARLRDTDHSLRAGERGPTLLQDHHLREKITHFDHERIPERVVHARGAGAHGTFVGYGAAAGLSSAAFLEKDVETPVFVRFSTVAGSRGSADSVRDTRGFAVKFYTEQGNFDLVGNNIPVFFIQDGIKFPDIVHAVKPHPDREIPQAQSAHDTFWDFVSLHTEAQHHTLWNMSDRGIPRSYRHMEGFGVHTFRLVDAEGGTTLVKFHWKPKLGVHSVTWEEAQLLGGIDPDVHRRDLYDAIEAGAFPQWELGVQAFEDTPDQTFQGIDLLDPTKLVPEELAPVQPLGLMTLTGTPTNFFAEAEQVAFHVGNLVAGIDVTDDPLMQVRLFSYVDTQLSRLGGPNYNQLPVNRPHAPVNDMLRDGMHQSAVHAGVAPYRPNSLDGGCPFVAGDAEGAFLDVPQAVAAGSKVRALSASFDDHFSQARLFWRSMTPVEQDHIVQAYTFELGKCYDETIRRRQLLALVRIDAGLAAAVAAGLGLPAPEAGGSDTPETPDVDPSPALSQLGGTWPVEGRTVAVVVDAGADPDAVAALTEALTDEQVVPLLLAATGGPVWPDRAPVAHRTLLTSRSVEFDAVVVAALLTPADDARQTRDAKAGHSDVTALDPRLDLLLDEAYRHGKAIGVVGDADTAAAVGLLPEDAGVVVGDAAAVAAGVLEALGTHRAWDRFTPSGA
ncbi:catalase [Phycicoccus sp. HDW14]|uniref:catalase n=1 Tax=Phycicoccus sp. HDW14 TaxID=2714941 RepID=UPI00140DA1F8|nr:catalase [Phycicoccus sp. HDW14]QIM22060.1 catalase [Phycicoccus sp. HDW14]